MGMLSQLIGYAGSALELLFALVVIVLGAAVLRPVSATAGYAVVAAGAVRLLLTCCSEVVFGAARAGALEVGSPDSIGWFGTVLSAIHHVVFWGLIAFAAFTVAQAKQSGQES